jgi:ABC-type nitrate/sulfonate/bicarbonate transport system permease component
LNIVVPHAGPQIAAGMRIAIAIAFIMIIVSEMFGAASGIGFVTLQAQQSFQITTMWTGMLLLGLLGVIVNTAFVLVERRVLRWYYK